MYNMGYKAKKLPKGYLIAMDVQKNAVFHTRIRRVKKRVSDKRHLTPTQFLLIGFLMLILIGALLLSLPISSKSGEFTPFSTSLFTATSATCITGLVVVDTGTYFSLFGQVVILILIQIGGLGFMTMAIMMSIFIKRQITPRERLLAAQSLGLVKVGGTVKLIRRILIGTFAIEGLGAAVLATQFIPIFGVGRGLYYGIFHAVSSFCNAGFDILDGTNGYGGGFTSMIDLRGNYVIGTTLMLLIIIGGIGFIVWDDVVNFISERKRFSVYTKFVLTLTVIAVFGGALAILICEWSNEATIGNMPLGDKIFQSLFQSVTTRTAGVDMIGNASLGEPAKVISMLLMFIGGASGSTAGGLKIGTFGILVLATLSVCRGRDELVVGKRTVPKAAVLRGLAVLVIDLFAVFVTAMLISLVDGFGVTESFFEAFSGIATVGLTLGITPHLSILSRVALIVLMFFGRVGILTISYSFLLRQSKNKNLIRYPDINMMIG